MNIQGLRSDEVWGALMRLHDAFPDVDIPHDIHYVSSPDAMPQASTAVRLPVRGDLRLASTEVYLSGGHAAPYLGLAVLEFIDFCRPASLSGSDLQTSASKACRVALVHDASIPEEAYR